MSSFIKNYKRYVVYCEREKDDEENNNEVVKVMKLLLLIKKINLKKIVRISV